MGMFKDLRKLSKTAKEMVPPEHRGIGGSVRMMRDGVAQATEMIGGIQQEQADAARLQTEGKRGTAVVKAATQTGAFVNENPQVRLELDVTVDGATYPAQVTTVVPMINIPSVQPGAALNVLVDPADPSKLVLA